MAMILFGAALNGGLVVLAGIIGSFLKSGVPEKISGQIMQGLSLVVVYIGISGTLSGTNALITVLSLAIGAIIGELIGLDRLINRLGDLLQSRLAGKGNIKIAEGFVTCSLLICVGAMAIIGSLESGLRSNHDTLVAKSIIDCIAAFIMAATMGIGVALSGVLVFIYEGAMALSAQYISPLLTEYVINEMACAGSVTIICVGLNMLGVTKIKVMNLVPGIFLPILLCRIL